MHTYVVDMLQCPVCHGRLAWDMAEHDGGRILEAEARCAGCGTTYPVREGIGLFLTPDLPRDDLWEQVDSGLMGYLREQPDVEHRLMDGPAEVLAPADQFFRAMVLEARGDYAQARVVAELARPRLYTPEYLDCFASQRRYVVDQLSRGTGPIVDLASGRCDLVEELARTLSRPIVATDFSPRVLRRDRRYLEFWGLYNRVSLLAFDARRTPFRDGAVATLTTNLGLPNIEQPERLLAELRRIVSGTAQAISYFLPEEDEANAAVARGFGGGALLFKREALARLAAAGWQATLANSCVGLARPTPHGVVMEGLGIDGMPVADTTLEWGVLVAH